MDKIYMNANDKNVAKTIVYVGVEYGWNYAYTDAECTNKMSADELLEAVTKNAVMYLKNREGFYALPVMFKKCEDIYALVIACTGDNTSSQNDKFMRIYSKEFDSSMQ